ncbi:MAG: DUF896 domain-containing protein [Acutalibacteraceae bacterium]|nr:DUF896 domain-containing protein [Acutalibacteraceae bacterium]
MDKKKIDRINELARKQKSVGLTDEEKAEQKALREEYLSLVKRNLTAQLDNTYIVRPDGTKQKIKKKGK